MSSSFVPDKFVLQHRNFKEKRLFVLFLMYKLVCMYCLNRPLNAKLMFTIFSVDPFFGVIVMH